MEQQQQDAEAMQEVETDLLQKIEAELNGSGVAAGRRLRLEEAATLLKKFKIYAAPPATSWRAGLLCKWKPGMSNRRYPGYEDIGVVTTVLSTPVSDPKKKDAGNPYFLEPLDLVVGFLDPEHEFITFHLDSRRFQVVEEADIAPKLVAKLKDLFSRFQVASPPFRTGDAVRWKEGLKNKKRPHNDEPAVVAEMLSEPVYDCNKDAGGQYFREPLDMRLSMMDSDGEFVVYHFDSRRFERVPAGQEGVRRPLATVAGTAAEPKDDEMQHSDDGDASRGRSFSTGSSQDGAPSSVPPFFPSSFQQPPSEGPTFEDID